MATVMANPEESRLLKSSVNFGKLTHFWFLLTLLQDFEYQNLPPKNAKKNVKYVDRKIVSGKLDPKLCHNGISTGKYNVITFIPKNLLEQFSKIANIYFLVTR